MTKYDQDRDVDFLENIARKAWLNMNYADAIELSLMEGELSHLIVEKIEQEEVEALEAAAGSAKERLEKAIADAEDLGFENTVKYLNDLAGDLPSGSLNLVNLIFKGDPKKAAKETGKITAVVNKIQAVEDSVKDAVVLFATQLRKLPYAQDPGKAAEEAAEAGAKDTESGEVEVDGEAVGKPEEVAAEAEKAFKDVPIKDLASNKFMTWAKGIQFPDAGTLEKAAKDAYKPPPEPEGFLGKLGGFFGLGELGAGSFASDIMNASLAGLIAKADGWAADADKEPTPVGADIGADLADLGKGDSSVVAGGGGKPDGGGGGGSGGSATTTVNVPGVGAVPVNPETTPGFDGDAAQAGEMKAVPWTELEKTVTAPEDVEGITPELAALINDDPKSDILFFDPEEAKKAAEEAKKAGEEPEKTTEGWVHTRSMKDWLFESSSRSSVRVRSNMWTHKTSLSKSLFSEAIFYKDVAKALKAQGVEDDKLDDYARDLAKRLENQYDVVVKDVPEPAVSEEVKEELVSVADSASGYSQEEVQALLADRDEFWDKRSKEEREWLASTLAARDQSEVEREAARKPPNIEMNQSQVQGLSAVFKDAPPPGKVDTEAPAGDKKVKKPTKKLLDRAKAAGVKYKKGEDPKNLQKRVARAEKKAKGEGTKKEVSKETRKKAIDKAKELGIDVKNKDGKSLSHETILKKIRQEKPKEAEVIEKEASVEMSQSQEQSLKATYYRRGNLVEALLGPRPSKKKTEDDELVDRWSELAGLGEE